ncbi:hypothetical protein L218DRAFT_1005308 [Marasmius fiardii PR-910]|nr:hypothetical protein L218DRAFT_1005308 [Marasmius fiardii PR-910]
MALQVIQHSEYVDQVLGDARLKLFKLETVHHAIFDIAVLLDKSSKARPEVGRPARFNEYWLNVHGQLFKAVAARYSEQGGRDGVAVLEADSIGKIPEVFETEELKKCAEDSVNYFRDRPSLPPAKMLPCDVVTFIDK